jgi:hypothetical protein
VDFACTGRIFDWLSDQLWAEVFPVTSATLLVWRRGLAAGEARYEQQLGPAAPGIAQRIPTANTTAGSWLLPTALAVLRNVRRRRSTSSIAASTGSLTGRFH